MIEGHGDDTYRYGGLIRHNFSTNVYGGFDHSGLKSHLSSVIDSIRNYPEPTPVTVETLLAQQKGIDPSAIMVTNGATEAIYIIAQSYRGCRSMVIAPTFSEYGDACVMHGHKLGFADSIHTLPTDVDVVWMCNPNNPTGRVMDKCVLLAYIDSHPSKTFIVDQAYADYTILPLITEQEAVERCNVVLLGSLTKRFAIPGLRIGYAVGNPCLIARFKSGRMPWSVNQLAIEGAKYLLGHCEDYTIDAAGLNHEALRIGRALEQVGIAIEPTDCNMLLCQLPYGTAAELKRHLVNCHGILIRDASNFWGLTERHFRVAALTPAENDMLINAITEWIS